MCKWDHSPRVLAFPHSPGYHARPLLPSWVWPRAFPCFAPRPSLTRLALTCLRDLDVLFLCLECSFQGCQFYPPLMVSVSIPSPQRGLSRPPYLVRLTPLHPPTSDLHHLTFITLLQACGCRVHLSTCVSLVSQPDSRVQEGREWLSVPRVTGTQHKTGPQKSTQSWLKG